MASAIPQTRIREVLKATLSNATTGLNARLATQAAAHSLDAFSIDWGPGSRNFFQGQLTPGANVEGMPELSQLAEFPALCLYTLRSQNHGRTKFSRFSGVVVLRIDLYLMFRINDFGNATALEQDDTETLADVAEEALLQTVDLLRSADGVARLPGNIHYLPDQTLIERGPLRLYGDGFGQLLQMTLAFSVTQ